MSDLILYTSVDGMTRMNLRVDAGNIWLSQLEIAELFQTTKQNVSLHAKNIFEDEELSPQATVKESLTVQTEGNRQVQRTISPHHPHRPHRPYRQHDQTGTTPRDFKSLLHTYHQNGQNNETKIRPFWEAS